jgi:hypothetical protein
VGWGGAGKRKRGVEREEGGEGGEGGMDRTASGTSSRGGSVVWRDARDADRTSSTTWDSRESV